MTWARAASAASMMRRRAALSSAARAAATSRSRAASSALQMLLDVGPRGHRAEAVGQVERRGRVGDPHDRPVLAHEPVLALVQRLTRVARLCDTAVLLRIRTAVGVLVVDRVVPRPADELGRMLVAERGQRGGVGVVEAAAVVDDPDGLRDPREDRVALAQRLLRLALRGHVDEGDDHPAAGRQVDGDRRVGDGEQRPVPADEPVLVGVLRLAGRGGQDHAALGGRERGAVRVPVVDRVVPVPSLQLGRVVVPQGGDRRRVGEQHDPVVVDDPDGLGHAVHDRLQRGVVHHVPKRIVRTCPATPPSTAARSRPTATSRAATSVPRRSSTTARRPTASSRRATPAAPSASATSPGRAAATSCASATRRCAWTGPPRPGAARRS